MAENTTRWERNLDKLRTEILDFYFTCNRQTENIHTEWSYSEFLKGVKNRAVSDTVLQKFKWKKYSSYFCGVQKFKNWIKICQNEFLWWPFMTFDIQKLWSEQSEFDVWWFVGMKLHRFSDLKTCLDIKSDKTHPYCSSSQPSLKNQNTEDTKHNCQAWNKVHSF